MITSLLRRRRRLAAQRHLLEGELHRIPSAEQPSRTATSAGDGVVIAANEDDVDGVATDLLGGDDVAGELAVDAKIPSPAHGALDPAAAGDNRGPVERGVADFAGDRAVACDVNGKRKLALDGPVNDNGRTAGPMARQVRDIGR